MSANPAFFDHVAPAARAFTRSRVRETGAPLVAAELDAFLSSTVEAYVADGGYGVDEDLKADVLPRVKRFCMKMKVTRLAWTPSNRALFAAVTPQVKEWCLEYRRVNRKAIDPEALRVAVTAMVEAYRAVPGQAHDDDGHVRFIEKRVEYFQRMTKTHAEGTRKKGATRSARQEADYHVQMRHDQERYFAEKEGRAPSYLSIDALLKGSGMKRSAIRGAVARLRGRPERQAVIDALPGTARDLVAVLEDSRLPMNRQTVVETDALAGKLWPLTTVASTRRKHRQRLREAAKDIEAAGIGLHLIVLGEHSVVGRGRLLPDAPDAFVAEALRKRKVRPIPAGLIASRQGDWGTPEGQDAQAFCRVVASHGGDADMARILVRSGLDQAVEDFHGISAIEHTAVHRDSMAWCSRIEERTSGTFGGMFMHASVQTGAAVEKVRSLIATARQDGLGAAWTRFIDESPAYEFRLARAESAPGRERVARIGRALAKAPTPEAWECTMLLHVVNNRPGRRARSIALPPERRRPGRDDVAAQTRSTAVPLTARTYVQPSSNGDGGYVSPSPVREWIGPKLETEITKGWRVNVLRPALRDFHLQFLGMTREETADIRDLPLVPGEGSIPEVLEGLRRLLRTWGGPVAEADAELDNALHEAVTWAGTVLKSHGMEAYVLAAGVVISIVQGLETVEKAAVLKSRLKDRRAELAFNLAKASDKSTAAA